MIQTKMAYEEVIKRLVYVSLNAKTISVELTNIVVGIASPLMFINLFKERINLENQNCWEQSDLMVMSLQKRQPNKLPFLISCPKPIVPFRMPVPPRH